MFATLQTGGIFRWAVIVLPAPCATPHGARKQWHRLEDSFQELGVFCAGLAGLCSLTPGLWNWCAPDMCWC